MRSLFTSIFALSLLVTSGGVHAAIMYEAEFNQDTYNPGDIGFITFRMTTDQNIPVLAFGIDLIGMSTMFQAPVFNHGAPDALFALGEIGATFVTNPIPTGIAVDFFLNPGTAIEPDTYEGPVFPFLYIGQVPAKCHEMLFVASATFSPGTAPFVSDSRDAVITCVRVPEASSYLMSAVGVLGLTVLSIIRKKRQAS